MFKRQIGYAPIKFTNLDIIFCKAVLGVDGLVLTRQGVLMPHTLVKGRESLDGCQFLTRRSLALTVWL